MGTSQRRVVGALLVIVAVLVVAAIVPFTAAAPPEGKPNDSQEAATEISSGETVTGTIPEDGDEDWFAFEAEAGETINLTADLGTGSGLKLHVFDPDGERVAGTRG